MPIEQYLNNMTVNAKKWAFFLQESVGKPPAEQEALALKRALPEIRDIIISNLDEAITKPPAEYDYSFYIADLRTSFSKEGIVRVVNGKIDLDTGAREIAGDEDDLYEGIQYARAKLKVTGAGGTKKAAEFWKTAVYGAARGGEVAVKRGKKKISSTVDLYDETIEARKAGFKRTTPYWLFLEFGTRSKYAFPAFGGTNFLRKSQRQAQKIFDIALEAVTNQAENIVLKETEKFIENPDSYAPREVLKEFYADGRTHLVYVTPTRRIGVRLR
jgi:HK97 gp10 family phage protein